MAIEFASEVAELTIDRHSWAVVWVERSVRRVKRAKCVSCIVAIDEMNLSEWVDNLLWTESDWKYL